MTVANRISKEFTGAIGLDASTTGVKFTTPEGYAHRLGVLQAIRYKRAVFLAFNDSDAAVSVRLMAGAALVDSLTVAGGAAVNKEIDLANISGSAALTVEVEITTAGSGTGNVMARLDIEQPLQVSTC